jgi:hypothetical protein
LTSNKTEALFLLLALLPGGLAMWRIKTGRKGKLTAISIFLCLFFLFYSLNYRSLVIRLTTKSLKIIFGLSSWVVPLDNIEDCQIDELPWYLRYGGAGIHFMMVRKRYRASFNFLEYPRVVIRFKNKVGPVQDISFSTLHPELLTQLIHTALTARTNACLAQ